jgi:hypothetical protein
VLVVGSIRGRDGKSQLQGVDVSGFNNTVSEGEIGQVTKAWKALKPEGQCADELLGQ